MEPIKLTLHHSVPHRLGTLKLGDVEVPTPATLLYTLAGSVPHLTVDNVRRICPEPHPLLVPLQTTYSMRNSVAALGMGITKFSGFYERHPVVQVIQDPLAETLTGFNDRSGVCIFDSAGKSQLSSESLTEVSGIFCPVAYQALTDGDTPKDCSNKRLANAVKRSIVYLEECIRAKEDSKIKGGILASIQGGYNDASRKFSVTGTLEAGGEQISGYIIDGFHMNGAETANLRFGDIAPLFNKVIDDLPEHKTRFMFGCFAPEMVIQLARGGIDCFDSSYACLQTNNNRALVFTFHEVRDAVEHVRFLQLDDGEKYKADMSVILEDCECYTCTEGFSRAYINHLIQTKELLAYILLQMHNLHHWLKFFDSLRADLKANQSKK